MAAPNGPSTGMQRASSRWNRAPLASKSGSVDHRPDPHQPWHISPLTYERQADGRMSGSILIRPEGGSLHAKILECHCNAQD